MKVQQKKQELNITPKPTKNKTREALKATQAKEAKRAKEAKKVLLMKGDNATKETGYGTKETRK